MTSKPDWKVGPVDDADGWLFLDESQARLLDAAVGRIIPTDDDPGAREANVVRFIDRYLSGHVYASADGSGFLLMEGKEADAWRVRLRALQERYSAGLRELDSISRRTFQQAFPDLPPEQQDEVLAEMSGSPKPERVDVRPAIEGEVVPGSGGAPPSNQPIPDDQLEFFPMLVLHTRQGFYSDPAYGGNADHVGWRVIGFPGPRSLAQTQRGEFSTLEYMLPDAIWPFAEGLDR